jgi:hypothetical protein
MLDAAIFFIADFLISAYITPKEEKKRFTEATCHKNVIYSKASKLVPINIHVDIKKR